jgi:UTP--glucose-1-phosphate uridylyltransferase
VAGDPFAVLLADDLMVRQTPIMKQMVSQFGNWRSCILALQDVPREQTQRYGIVSGTAVGQGMVDVTGIVEKPTPELAPTTFEVAGFIS